MIRGSLEIIRAKLKANVSIDDDLARIEQAAQTWDSMSAQYLLEVLLPYLKQ